MSRKIYQYLKKPGSLTSTQTHFLSIAVHDFSLSPAKALAPARPPAPLPNTTKNKQPQKLNFHRN